MNSESYRAARCLTLRAARLREEIDAQTGRFLWGDGELEDFIVIRRVMMELTEEFLIACERVAKASRKEKENE